MSLQVKLSLTTAVVSCGAPVTGYVSWSGNDKGQEVGVVLFVRSEGRGDDDSQIAGTHGLGNAAHGEAGFSIPVPVEGPVTYHGSLLRVLWHIVVAVPPKSRVPRLDRVPAGTDVNVVPWGWFAR